MQFSSAFYWCRWCSEILSRSKHIYLNDFETILLINELGRDIAPKYMCAYFCFVRSSNYFVK